MAKRSKKEAPVAEVAEEQVMETNVAETAFKVDDNVIKAEVTLVSMVVNGNAYDEVHRLLGEHKLFCNEARIIYDACASASMFGIPANGHSISRIVRPTSSIDVLSYCKEPYDRAKLISTIKFLKEHGKF